jgi:prepilin-type N-terminal cleavage/methylation domain-containing protein
MGFTLIETLVVIAVVGAIAAIAAPSFLSVMDSVKVDQTIAEIRGAFQETQRQAIRKSQLCSVSVEIASVAPSGGNTGGSTDSNEVLGNCLTSGDRKLPQGVDMATNILGNATADVAVQFGSLGGADFGLVGNNSITLQDPSGKIVALVPTRSNVKMKCIAISNTLGLTRVGNYIGETNPTSISQSGICTALEWDKQ